MIEFEARENTVVLVYTPEFFGALEDVDRRLDSGENLPLARTFTLTKADLVGEPADDEDETRRFNIGTVEDGYRRIRKDVLGLNYDLLLASTVKLDRKTFVGERNISIFRKIDDLIDEQIVVGGEDPAAVPEADFRLLLKQFPTSTELRLHSSARIASVLREYFETMTDSEQRLTDHMARRARSWEKAGARPHGRVIAASELELQKFNYVRDTLARMLKNAESYHEADWQLIVADLFLLIYPQYVAVLHNVNVKERYSDPSRTKDRYVDLMLVGSNGEVDVIEIKRPIERGLVSRGKYRGNFVPVRELSGALMQAEKYLFYLSKWGQAGERAIAEKHRAELPPDMAIKIVNPKAIILTGRDEKFSDEERFDFEFARRAYSNVVDIISYDDLLRRLDNIIVSLRKRLGEGAADPVECEDTAGVAGVTRDGRL